MLIIEVWILFSNRIRNFSTNSITHIYFQFRWIFADVYQNRKVQINRADKVLPLFAIIDYWLSIAVLITEKLKIKINWAKRGERKNPPNVKCQENQSKFIGRQVALAMLVIVLSWKCVQCVDCRESVVYWRWRIPHVFIFSLFVFKIEIFSCRRCRWVNCHLWWPLPGHWCV